jgi:(p)ppGpp synthase/HD superfamily hydrolase
MSDLTTAIKIACEVHANQKDKAGEPYILHPLRLMQRLKGKETMMVAILHDVIEDSQLDLGFLEAEGFDKRIVNAVDAITKRTNESYQDFIERLSINEMAVKVKIEDIKDNLDLTRLSSVDEKDMERIKRYHKALIFLEKIGVQKVGDRVEKSNT